jgi:hypothetical protein
LIQKLLLILLLVIASQVNAEEKFLLCNSDEYGGHKAFLKVPKNSKIFVKFTDTFFSGKKIEYRVGSGDWKQWCQDYKSGPDKNGIVYQYKADQTEFIGNTAICKLIRTYDPQAFLKIGDRSNHDTLKKMWASNPSWAKSHLLHGRFTAVSEIVSYLNFSELYQETSSIHTVTDGLGHSDTTTFAGQSYQKSNCELP